MTKRIFLAALLTAALVLQGAGGAWATNKDKESDEDRDGHSRYELAPLAYLPLVFAGAAQERIAKMYIMMQQVSYLIEMTTGVKATSQNRVSLGGLFGGVFARTYSAEDFVESLEVGTVYRAGDGLLAVAMEGDEVLTDHKVIVFNGDYQYDPKALPSLQQIEPAQLQKLQAYSLMVELANHVLTAEMVTMMAKLNHMSAADLNGTPGLTPAHETEIPVLRKLIVGKVYRGPDNTLLVVIPPTIVLDR
jgi:hypothetical protein